MAAFAIDFYVKPNFQPHVKCNMFTCKLLTCVGYLRRLWTCGPGGSLQITLHQLYRGTQQSSEEMIDLLENGGLHPRLDVAVDVRAVFDAVACTDACEPPGSSLKLHLVSVRDRLAQRIIRRTHWVDTRDMLADVFLRVVLIEHCGIRSAATAHSNWHIRRKPTSGSTTKAVSKQP